MRKYIFLFIVGLTMSACGGHDHAAEGHNHAAEAAAHGEGGAPGEIVLEPEVAERFGLRTDSVVPGDFRASVRAAGMVISSSAADAVVSAPVAGTVHFAAGTQPGASVAKGSLVATIDAAGTVGANVNAAAGATLEAARADYERVKELYADQLATKAELIAAQGAYESARAAYTPAAASGRALSPVAGTITSLAVREGQYVDAGEVIAGVATPGDVVLRVDLPQRHRAVASTFTDANIVEPYGGRRLSVSELGGRRISGAAMPADNAPAAFVPIYFSLPKTAGLDPGVSLSVYLVAGTPKRVLTVPVEALSEQQGDFFVYEKLDEECYMKHRVVPGATDGRRTEILSGLTPGMTIVTEGVTTVRLAESGSVIPEGHTHNH